MQPLQIDSASAIYGATMKAIKMFCGELDGELVPSHLAFRANRVRHSIAELFFGITWGDTPGWYLARKAGWRVVPVRVVPWKSREA